MSQGGTSSKPGRWRTRLVIAALAALGGAAAWVVAARRPQLPDPAVEPPRLGYSANGSTPQVAARRV
jgi:hypothetical protein